MPVIQTQDSEAPPWTIISSLTNSTGRLICIHLFTSTVSPVKFTVQFSWSTEGQFKKNFRYTELHFKISPGNPVAFRHEFNLILTCSIHCVNMALVKRIECVQLHGSQSPIKLLRVSHCVTKSLISLTWFNLSI